jgi:hypothetical protein
MPVSSQARHIKINNDLLVKVVGKQRNENEGFGPLLIHNRRLENLMLDDCGPLFCKSIRRFSLPAAKTKPEDNEISTPRCAFVPKLCFPANSGSLANRFSVSPSIMRGTPNRRNSVTEPLKPNMCARGSALAPRDVAKPPPQTARPARAMSAGAVRGVHYSRPVSAASLPQPLAASLLQPRLLRSSAALATDRSGLASAGRRGWQLYLRPRVVPMPLSARLSSPHTPPPMQASPIPCDAPHPVPPGGDAAEHGGVELRGMEDLLFDFVSVE